MKRFSTKVSTRMNRREFNELINYISNRPDEALRLEAVINKAKMGKTPGRVTDVERDSSRWLTASEVGKEMGRSHQWVKDKDKILPDSAKRRGARGAHLYLWNDNTRHLFNIQL